MTFNAQLRLLLKAESMSWKPIQLVLLLCFVAFIFLANKDRRKETRESNGQTYDRNGQAYDTVTAHFDVKGSLFWGIVVLEFQADDVYGSRHTKVELVATDLDAIKQIEGLQGNKAVVITLSVSHKSAGNQIDKFFYDFSTNQFMTTNYGKMSNQQFMDFVNTWQQHQRNAGQPQPE